MPHRYIVSGTNLPAPPSPISQAVVAGTHCYVSGQLAVDETGTFRSGSAREEAELSFRNLFAALSAAGFAREDVVYVDIAFIDLRDIAEVNRLFAELFPEGGRPARTVYQAAALPFGGKIKVQCVAVRQADSLGSGRPPSV
jgi:2-iminobutanoate/2-iminopropanoate deaminase